MLRAASRCSNSTGPTLSISTRFNTSSDLAAVVQRTLDFGNEAAAAAHDASGQGCSDTGYPM